MIMIMIALIWLKFELYYIFQARNFMRDQMKMGHLAFFYHSNCKNPGIAGIVKVNLTNWLTDWLTD